MLFCELDGFALADLAVGERAERCGLRWLHFVSWASASGLETLYGTVCGNQRVSAKYPKKLLWNSLVEPGPTWEFPDIPTAASSPPYAENRDPLYGVLLGFQGFVVWIQWAKPLINADPAVNLEGVLS